MSCSTESHGFHAPLFTDLQYSHSVPTTACLQCPLPSQCSLPLNTKEVSGGRRWRFHPLTELLLRERLKVQCSQVTYQCCLGTVSGLRVLPDLSSPPPRGGGASPRTECQSARGGPKGQQCRETNLLLFSGKLGDVLDLFSQLVPQFLIGNPVIKHTGKMALP